MKPSLLVNTIGGNATVPAEWKRTRYGLAAIHFLSLLVMYFFLRLVLYVQFCLTVTEPFSEIVEAFLVGLFRDVFVALALTIPVLIWFWIVPERWFAKRWHRIVLGAGFFVFWLVQPFLFAAEYFFFEEFRSRFNTVAVDYLIYPHEVFINIWEDYPVGIVIVACALFSAGWLYLSWRACNQLWRASFTSKVKLIHLGAAVGLLLLLTPPLNLKGVRFSEERLLNELADNGSISFMSAAWTRDMDYPAFYKTLPKAEAYQRVRRLLDEPRTKFVGDIYNIRRRVIGDANKPRLNVVLILEESLGSEFFGSLGRDKPTLTPELDRLAAEEGMFFVNIYASGNRTVRGMEGILSGFPPLPSDSIVKRDRSENVASLARILKRDGYQTLFIYAGRGVFDGMRAYALDNGYDRFIEQKHFENPTFATIWGVCDEDLLNRGLEECRTMHESGEPFFTTLLTMSNHKPYTYPKGRIAEDPDARKREHVVKYTDYTLGEFFRNAKQEPWWTNTIFVVVADHGARVYGSQSIPIHSYEIPFLILGPAAVKEPVRIPHLGCSLDVGPTILGLIGRPYDTMFFGLDLLNTPTNSHRVFLNHNRNIGMFTQDRMVVLGLKQTVEFYKGDPKKVDPQLIPSPTPSDLELEKDAVAVFQVADDLYMKRAYRIDPEQPSPE